jgi:hypothetical protein
LRGLDFEYHCIEFANLDDGWKVGKTNRVAEYVSRVRARAVKGLPMCV